MKVLFFTASFFIAYQLSSFSDTIIVRKDPRLDVLSTKQA